MESAISFPVNRTNDTFIIIDSAKGNTLHEYWLDSTEKKIGDVLQKYINPLSVALGTILNLTVLVLVIRSHLVRSSMGLYLAAFIVVNTVVLYIDVGLDWLADISGQVVITDRYDWLCRLGQFLFSVIEYSAHWFVVLMLVDRAVYVWFPLQAPAWCTQFVAKVLSVLVYVGLACVAIHAMWTYELGAHGCNIDYSQHAFQTVIWPWISAIVYSYVPLLVIAILLVMLLFWLAIRWYPLEKTSRKELKYFTVALVLAGIHLPVGLPVIAMNLIGHEQPAWLVPHHNYAMFYMVAIAFHSVATVNRAITGVVYLVCLPSLREHLRAIVQMSRPRQSTVPLGIEVTSLIHHPSHRGYVSSTSDDGGPIATPV